MRRDEPSRVAGVQAVSRLGLMKVSLTTFWLLRPHSLWNNCNHCGHSHIKFYELRGVLLDFGDSKMIFSNYFEATFQNYDENFVLIQNMNQKCNYFERVNMCELIPK